MMKNDNGHATNIVVIVFTSLIFSTTLISYFLMAMFGLSVAGIDLPAGRVEYLPEQDFLTNQINETTIDISRFGEWRFFSGIGKVLYKKAMLIDWSYLLINNIQKDSLGMVTNTYHINNSVKGDYTIVLRYTSGSDQSEFTITNDGIHVPFYFLNVVISSPLVIRYPNMNQIEDVIIITSYNDKLNYCDITFNAHTFRLDNLVNDNSPENLFGRYYGGVASNTLGFTIERFYTNNIIVTNPDANILAQFGAFITIAFKLILYNVDPIYLPWELNILLIKTQTIALLVGIIVIARGGS